MNSQNFRSNPLQPGGALDLTKLPVISYAEGERPACLLARGNTQQTRPFALMRGKFQKKLQELEAQLVGLTSATPDVGKSFVSCALASSFARVSESPVVLVDLDLRRASVAEYLGLEVGKGVNDYLADPQVKLEDIALRLADTNLVILPTRQISGNSAELLAGPRYEEFTRSLRDLGPDVTCIFDLPPAFANDDAMISLEQIDGYLLIVEYAKTTKRHILDAISMLEPARCFGSVLNKYEGSFGDSYGYGSAAYSRYYD